MGSPEGQHLSPEGQHLADAEDPWREELPAACALWQSGQVSGSSAIRGAARVLTGVPHYFEADFITAYEDQARRNPVLQRHAEVLLRAIAASQWADADGWNAQAGLEPHGFAGRGIKAKPEGDAQIRARITSGHIEMPLWGVSLDRAVTESYGGRFRFEIVGPFPGVAAWLHSGVKDVEKEIITGGTYRVLSTEQDGSTTVVRLEAVHPPTQSRDG